MATFKFSDSSEGEEDSTEHWDNIALPDEEFILHRGKHACHNFGAFLPMDQSLYLVLWPAREPTVFELINGGRNNA